jgi:hypothetical protein
MERAEQNFEIRSYSKTELAVLYNPLQTVDSARQTFRRWIATNKQLLGALTNVGYSKSSHLLTPNQVRVIVRYLGEP